MLELRHVLLPSAALAGLLVATAPVEAAVVFRSADVSVFSRTDTLLDLDFLSDSDASVVPRTLQAEANVFSGLFGDNFAGANIGALATLAPDGLSASLSAGFRIITTQRPLNTDSFEAEVRYAFHYRFDVTTAARFIGDWTVSFPTNVSIALTGATPPLDDPLPASFGSHQRLLPAGSYELTFSAEGQTDEFHPQLPGYSIRTLFGTVDFRGFDIYSFQIIDAPVPSVPEPASGLLLALGLALWWLRGANARPVA